MSATGKGRGGTQKTTPKSETAAKKALVKKVIQNIRKRLKSDELKPTLGDFVRLVQLEKELEEEEPREIKVTWVEPAAEENASET